MGILGRLIDAEMADARTGRLFKSEGTDAGRMHCTQEPGGPDL